VCACMCACLYINWNAGVSYFCLFEKFAESIHIYVFLCECVCVCVCVCMYVDWDVRVS